MRSTIFYFLCFILPLASCSQKINENLKYLEQKPPSLSPEIFAPGIISKSNESEFGSVFNKDATSFYYGVDIKGRTQIRHTEYIEGKWTQPRTLLSNEKYGFNDPFLSPDEKRLYFISEMSLDGLTAKEDHDIWFVEKRSKGWSEPINAGSNINTGSSEYYISFTESGKMYFSSNKSILEETRKNFNIYTSEYIDGEFQEAKKLGDAVNTLRYEADVFVDPNETYIIFCAKRKDSLGRGDLYISFKDTDGNWTSSINMGNKINTENHELCPFVSNDGKYLFYTSNQDIYWVSAKVIDDLKNSVLNK